ncbi:hypothetical protein [Pseudosulfitobacter pseudonitzschiae]|uniref:hypothetical protein n=1 Tax=Pseudosulfitobacter pseudonitzschiae TaxID=1402135 RepID=UPI001AFBE6DE|nr:hypothetical protein [Pseudosulfitobacter pseudonitzschiae]MBM1816251.1 hypothetical protein [Pseudosulfitobacter pseudonitzschiae]MBM1833750.1 hypothetical protein [Pseudosulfitobacter pseudonitzschiae]MBM1838616.1 hypothetical protein [Pseudosulfitobacter pseudonitzschiae]MBM1842964.1 hypothetical protein [Pseudosulfitobacter pseudonitzschiae]MBM1847830.1 hypothetical protein [Pseudosulfitobacter pseudonitzschiae]
MRSMLLAGVIGLAWSGLAGIGHNMPPTPAAYVPHQNQCILPRRIVDDNRRNQKLKQKLRRTKRRQYLQNPSRERRKEIRFGPGYRPGKLFKGHRV